MKTRYMNLYKLILCLLFFLSDDMGYMQAQSLAVKTNVLYDFTTSVSLGGEIRCTPSATCEIFCSYNPWTFSDNRKMKHFLAQAEYRWWRDEAFNGEFYGLQVLFCQYNIGGSLPLGIDFNKRYQGHLYGIGGTYGYQWPLSVHWNLETALSVGYIHFSYDSYGLAKNAEMLGGGDKNYFGLTKLGISFIYIIK